MGTVLVVEDDRSIRDSIRTLLQMEGYTALTAANGQEALDLLDEAKLPDLILLDLMMPVMDGFKFREIQRSIGRASHIPIVIMSADGNTARKKEQIGADDYLRKPVDINVLLDVVGRYC